MESDPQKILCATYEYLVKTYKNRLKETDSLLSLCGQAKLSWQKNETLLINEKFKDAYPKNAVEKMNGLKAWIKFYMLTQLDVNKKLSKDYEFEKNQDLFVKSINRFKKNVNRIITDEDGIEWMMDETILYAIATACDPHTAYFTPEVNKKFTESLSQNEDVYGFYVEENENKQVCIGAIKPGSPAWKSNKLNKGDVVTEIRFKTKSYDVTDMDADEVDDILDASKETELDMNVLKKNGATDAVHLVKASMQSDENVINSFVLSGNKPIGYIPLPSFYTDFSELTASGCANDVAKEIMRLKQENIQGLILDLRNNGGGSLEEAINLAGIFIDAAPLCLMKVGDQKPVVMKDFNRGSIYNGPLVILINKASASASEILAQMLKDQHRAIIAGGQSYGKATGQVVIPLDTTVSLTNANNKFNESDGFIKITIEKFYNLQGKTHQAKGVDPDIVIPDLYSFIPIGEQYEPEALSNDEITKKVNIEAPVDAKLFVCKEQNQKRMDTSRVFKKVLMYADSVKNAYAQTKTIVLHPLWYGKLVAAGQNIEKFSEEQMINTDTTFQVKPTNKLLEIMKMDTYLKETIDDQTDDLKKDLILKEAYNVLMDYLN